ncbi:Uncharacterised protein [Bordetella pertussis]|nr:Uncharacterised protein [Bordetella pertussis]
MDGLQDRLIPGCLSPQGDRHPLTLPARLQRASPPSLYRYYQNDLDGGLAVLLRLCASIQDGVFRACPRHASHPEGQ